MINLPINNKLTKKQLRDFILNVINTQVVESNYISLHLQLMLKDNDLLVLGNIFIVDKTNPKSIKGCLFNFEIAYNSLVLKIDDLEISQLVINYKEVNRSEFLSYVKNFYQDK